MPVILPSAAANAWLDPGADLSALQSLMAPLPGELLELYPVHKFVGSPKNDGPSCIERIDGRA
jgi:putative SOS response-associated peptidase YedK